MKFMEKLLVGEKVEWKKLGDLIEKYSENIYEINFII